MPPRRRARCHRTGDRIRELLLLGLVAQKEIKKGSCVEKSIVKLKEKRFKENQIRRVT